MHGGASQRLIDVGVMYGKRAGQATVRPVFICGVASQKPTAITWAMFDLSVRSVEYVQCQEGIAGEQERKTGLAAGHGKTALDGEVLREGLGR